MIYRRILLLEIFIEGCDFLKGAFSESEPSTIPYNDMEIGPSFDPMLSSVKELQSLERVNANPFYNIGDTLKDSKESKNIRYQISRS
jgi:hypothetical protein